jgi:predicted Fe-Mo cluster-binding NifX family protein
MKNSAERLQKNCLNAWYKFLVIFCFAVLTVFVIFEMEKNHIRIDFGKSSKMNEESVDYILIASTGTNIASPVAVQFETCKNFILVDEKTNGYASISNSLGSYTPVELRGFIRKQNIEAVITGTMEISSFKTLTSAHVEVFTGVIGTVEEALRKYRRKELVSFSHHYLKKNSINSVPGITGKSNPMKRTVF